MSKTKKMIVLLTVLAVMFTASMAIAAPKVLKLSHLNAQQPFENATGAMAAVFKSMVEAGTNGSVQVEVYPAGTPVLDESY